MNWAVHMTGWMRGIIAGASAIITGAACLFFFAHSVHAFSVEQIGDTQKNDFVLMPAKLEVTLNPGQSTTKEISVTNRTAETKEFRIIAEDFTGSQDPARPTVLLGSERGPYSLKDFLHPETTAFTLRPGEKATFAVRIEIPGDAEPGGLYGTILITSMSGTSGAAPLISRLGALFFVRVNGEVEESGKLEDFKTKEGKTVYTNGSPAGFSLYYRNDGSVHTNPYGYIEVKNMLGSTIDRIEVLPYFALPQSFRLRDIEWGRSLLWGKYQATAFINRGYDDIVDTLSVEFWILPWQKMAVGFVGIFVILFIARWIFGNYRIIRRGMKK